LRFLPNIRSVKSERLTERASEMQTFENLNGVVFSSVRSNITGKFASAATCAYPQFFKKFLSGGYIVIHGKFTIKFNIVTTNNVFYWHFSSPSVFKQSINKQFCLDVSQ
jgi:hypothetical protein